MSTEQEPEELKVRVEYTKTGMSRYIAHLDNIDVVTKALRRLQLPYEVSQGCHVRPKLSFAPPLPLGHASLCEYFVMVLKNPIDPESLKKNLSENLPKGMEVTKVIQPWVEKRGANKGSKVKYNLYFSDKDTAETSLTWLTNPETSFHCVQKGKEKSYILGDGVLNASITEHEDQTVITAEFKQGMAGVPSVSKITTALADYLGSKKDSLQLIERINVTELQ